MCDGSREKYIEERAIYIYRGTDMSGLCRLGKQLLVYGDGELVHAPMALDLLAVITMIVEHHGHHLPGDEAALVFWPMQHMAAARGLPPAASGQPHRPRLVVVLVLAGAGGSPLPLFMNRTTAAGRLLELPPAEEVDVAVLLVALVHVCMFLLVRSCSRSERGREGDPKIN